MIELVLIYIAALLIGVMWGGLHSSLWIEMKIPILHKLARAVRNEQNARMPAKNSLSMNAFAKFTGSLVGTSATAGAFSFIGDSLITLAIYTIGLFIGFFPAVYLVAVKYKEILIGILSLAFVASQAGINIPNAMLHL